MVINGDANSEEMKVAIMTANDYLWDSENYNAERSVMTAMQKRYGNELKEHLLKYKDIELILRKKIGQRALWFVADTLWGVIRKAK